MEDISRGAAEREGQEFRDTLREEMEVMANEIR
jgi:hypothetical protein